MSGGIRRQLGPVRKRLRDRIDEVSQLIEKGEITALINVRPKLTANSNSHSKLIDELGKLDVTNLSEDENSAINDELEKGAELQMDAEEVLSMLNEAKKELQSEGEMKVKVKEEEKLTREIEKIRIETQYAKLQLEKLQINESDKSSQKVRLPKLSLPYFDGKITEWPSFWDSFESTIHKNRELAKVDKFKYLLASLHGDAKETLAGFNLSEIQYDQAVMHLKERYDNKEYIVHTYYTTLSNLTRSSNSTTDIRKTFNIIETQLRSLESLGENIMNNYIVSLIKSKVPAQFNLKLEESRVGEWNTNILRKSINKLLLARERSEESYEEVQRYEYAGEGLLCRDVKIRCTFCGKGHWADECQMYKTSSERKGRIRGRCFVCLGEGHRYSDCRSKKPCFHCKRKGHHHSSLCPEKFSQNSDDVDKGHRDDIDNGLIGDEISVNLSNEVIMKTAMVKIRDEKCNKEVVANMLLDTGAKRSYITLEKAKSLGLKLGPKKIVRLNTFGSTNPSSMSIHETELILRLRDGSCKKIRAKICKNISGTMVKSKFDVMKYRRVWKDLEMADGFMDSDERRDIDLLIGNDYYDEVMKSERIQVDEGLYLVNSTLGWMFSGRTRNERTEDVELGMFVEENDVDISAFWNLETIGLNDEDEYNEKEADNNVQEFRFCRVIWGIVCSAFLLASVILYHLAKYHGDVSTDISRHIYVDNLISGASSTEKGIEYYKETKTIFNKASMNMCQWATNDKDVMNMIECNDRSSDEIIKVLGMIWDLSKDTLKFPYKDYAKTNSNISKRSILQVICGVYDPLGMICPNLLEPKLLIQSLWSLKIGWDDNVPEKIKMQWTKWVEQLDYLNEVVLERCIDDKMTKDSNIVNDGSKQKRNAAVVAR